MTGKIKHNQEIQTLFLAILMSMTVAATGCGCASTAEIVEAELTEIEATTSDAQTENTNVTDEKAIGTEKTSEEITTDIEENKEGTTTAAEETTTEAETTAAAETTMKEAATTTTKTTSEEPTAATSGYTYTSMSKTMYVKSQVNVRSLPSTDGTKLGSLSAGTAVTVTGQCNETNWYRIEYNGSVGYVSNNYLTSTKPSTTTTTTTTKASSGGSTTTTTTVSEATLKAYAEEVVELVNKERKAAGLWEYETNSKLTEAAMARAKELATSFSHTRPDGTDCETVLTEYGICYITMAENIAKGQTTPEAVMDAWMASALHCGNIMAEGYLTKVGSDGITYESYINAIGVGCYYKNGTYYWVQVFAELHTHTWDDEICMFGWTDDPNQFVYAYTCTNPFCNAYKDEDGVVHEHYN